jgi:hypothetical protein
MTAFSWHISFFEHVQNMLLIDANSRQHVGDQPDNEKNQRHDEQKPAAETGEEITTEFAGDKKMPPENRRENQSRGKKNQANPPEKA